MAVAPCVAVAQAAELGDPDPEAPAPARTITEHEMEALMERPDWLAPEERPELRSILDERASLEVLYPASIAGLVGGLTLVGVSFVSGRPPPASCIGCVIRSGVSPELLWTGVGVGALAVVALVVAFIVDAHSAARRAGLRERVRRRLWSGLPSR